MIRICKSKQKYFVLKHFLVKIVTHQLGCTIERAEDFEHGARETETKIKVR